MQKISLIFLAVLLLLTFDPLMVCSRTPSDDVDTTSLEDRRSSRQLESREAIGTVPGTSPERPRTPGSQEEIETEGVTRCSDNPGLAGCGKERQEAEMDKSEYRRLRIEVIKQKILQKLRLKAPPQVKLQRGGLPSLLLSNSEALLQDTDSTEFTASVEGVESTEQARRGNLRASQPAHNGDNFYGTTKNVFVFPDNSSASQLQCSQRSSVCLTFHLSAEAFAGNLVSSHLWLYKQTVPSLVEGTPVLSNQTLVVYDTYYDRQYGIIRKRILAVEDDEPSLSSGGWIRLRVDRAVRRWVTKPHLVHVLEVSCKSCGLFPVPMSQESGQQPFLVLSVGPPTSLNRRRRDLDCTNTTTRCCRESFYLSFKEIGWDEWIIQPPGYTANFCKGTCLNDVSTSRYHHTSVLNRYLQNQRSKNEEPIFSLCCTPSKMSPISLIYLDEGENLFQKSLPNMVVESCDCA